MSEAVSRAEFARRQGWQKSYVTKLGKAGRLVLDDAGCVLVDATMARIAETADPSRAAPADEPAEPLASNHDYQTARAKREHYLALQAEADYLRGIGELVLLSAVEDVGANMGATLRSALERLPVRLAPELAMESDEARVRALLADALDDVLREVSRLMSQVATDLVEASR